MRIEAQNSCSLPWKGLKWQVPASYNIGVPGKTGMMKRRGGKDEEGR